MHPEYNQGSTTTGGAENGELKILDESYVFPEGYEFIRDGKLRSPWYDNECRRSPNAQFIAQELDIDFIGAGGTYFDPKKIDWLIEKFARKADTRGEIFFEPAPNCLGGWITATLATFACGSRCR